jgi:hypothetical protein
VNNLRKAFCLPLLLALTFTAGVAPAGAEQDEDPPGWPPVDTGGRYVPVASEYYDEVKIEACGSTVKLTSGDVREVEEKVTVRRDGRVVIKYRGGATIDLERASDKAFIDELDVSGPGSERWSADQTDLSISLRGPSIIWPLSPSDAAAIKAAGLPEFSYFAKGRLTFELTLPDDPAAEPDVEITRNVARDVKDVCKMLDEAAQ